MDKEYESLLNYYREMFELVDVFHFNSSNTKMVYKRIMDIKCDVETISITHSGISDNRKKIFFSSDILHCGFVGNTSYYKGFPLLKDVVKQLDNNGFDGKIELFVYGGKIGIDSSVSNIHYKGKFTSNMLSDIFNQMDLLIVPSICYETFSLITLEALSYGVPVLVSNNVGAKDIVTRYSEGFVYDNKEKLYEKLKSLIDNRNELISFNEQILRTPWNWSMKDHVRQIEEKLYL